MIYREDTRSYNDRRYGKPWIAKLTFIRPGKPEYTFGDWLGNPGYAGELSIEVEPGDVIATGQKDHRKGRGGADSIGVVQHDGTVDWGYTAAAARDAGKKIKSQPKPEPEPEPEIDLLSLGM